MEEVRYKDVMIDKCDKCHAIWLDGGELDKIQQKVKDDMDNGIDFCTGMMLGGLLF